MSLDEKELPTQLRNEEKNLGHNSCGNFNVRQQWDMTVKC